VPGDVVMVKFRDSAWSDLTLSVAEGETAEERVKEIQARDWIQIDEVTWRRTDAIESIRIERAEPELPPETERERYSRELREQAEKPSRRPYRSS